MTNKVAFTLMRVTISCIIQQEIFSAMYATASVTKSCNLLHFGQLFKACGNNYIAHSCRQFLKGLNLSLF